MFKMLRLATSLVAAVALVVTMSPAYAGPPVDSRKVNPDTTAPHKPPKPKHTDTRKLSKAERTTIKRAVRIVQHSVGKGKAPRKRVLDYAKADKWDQGDVKLRRQVAAGWIVARRKIIHLSKAEEKKVHAYVPKGDPYDDLETPEGIHCDGYTKIVRYKPLSNINFKAYYDSCASVVIAVTMASIGITTAVVGAFLLADPATVPAGLMVMVIGGVVALGGAYLGAIIINANHTAFYVRDHYYLLTAWGY